MKKIFAVLLVLILAVGVMAGCMNNNGEQNPANPENVAEEVKETAEDVKNAAQDAVDTSNFIGEERAKEIALERAGIAADGVVFDRVELDNDDGVWQYEVDFKKDTTEYDVDVKADDGTILKYEQNHND